MLTSIYMRLKMNGRKVKHRKHCFQILAVLLSMLLLASCNFFEVIEITPNQPIVTPGPSDYVAVLPEQGGSLTIASTKYQTLDPLQNTNYYIHEILGVVYDGLMSLQDNLEAAPLLVESITSTPDALIWTIKLREDITWHDGNHFSNKDVKYTLDQIIANPDSPYYHNVENVKSYEIEGAYLLTITCKQPDSFLAEKLIFPVVPEHVAERRDQPVGTGKYKVRSVTADSIVLTSASNNLVSLNRKNPYINTITVKLYEKVTDVLYSDCDILAVKYEDYQKIEGKVGYAAKKYVSPQFEILAVNTTRNALANASVRRALAIGIDRNGAVSQISFAQALASDLPVFPEHWIKSTGNSAFPYEVQEAKRMLKQSGSEGMELTCIVNETHTERIQYAEYFQARLEELGLKLHIEKLSQEVFQSRLTNKEYDLALLGIQLTGPQDLLQFYGTGAGSNITGYSNERLDTLLKELSKETAERKRRQIFSEIESLLLNDVPLIGLYYKQNFIFYNGAKVFGVTASRPNYQERYPGIETWYTRVDGGQT